MSRTSQMIDEHPRRSSTPATRRTGNGRVGLEQPEAWQGGGWESWTLLIDCLPFNFVSLPGARHHHSGRPFNLKRRLASCMHRQK